MAKLSVEDLDLGGKRVFLRVDLNAPLADGRIAVEVGHAQQHKRQDENSAKQTLEQIRQLAPRSILVKADLESEEQTRGMVRTAVRELGRLDIVVYNAVTTTTKPLLTVKPTSFWRTMGMNLGGLFTTAQELFLGSALAPHFYVLEPLTKAIFVWVLPHNIGEYFTQLLTTPQ